MPSFLTQCPHCLTSFRVTDVQLDAAEGLVRCGACLGIFSAAANRITLKQTPEDGVGPDEFDELEDENFAALEFDDDDDAEVAAPAEELVVSPQLTPDTFASPDTELAYTIAEISRSPSPATDVHAEADLMDAEDVDIPLGDFNLDDDEQAEEDDEVTFDEDDAGNGADDDEEDEDEAEVIYEEYQDEAPVADASVQDDDEDDEQDADEEEIEEPAPPVPQRVTGERISADKTELRRYLAAIEDDDALGTIDDDAALDSIDEPVMLDSAPRRSRLASVALFVANLLLAGVLLLQVANANIDALSRNASLAFLMPVVCNVFECPLPERSRLDLFVSEQLLVRSHPRFAQALEVNLVFRNDATVAQPFPALELGFHDTANRPLANRLFAPSEYLPPELRTSEMPAQSSLQITLELADPGSEAVNYTLAFRRPQ